MFKGGPVLALVRLGVNTVELGWEKKVELLARWWCWWFGDGGAVICRNGELGADLKDIMEPLYLKSV